MIAGIHEVRVPSVTTLHTGRIFDANKKGRGEGMYLRFKFLCFFSLLASPPSSFSRSEKELPLSCCIGFHISHHSFYYFDSQGSSLSTKVEKQQTSWTLSAPSAGSRNTPQKTRNHYYSKLTPKSVSSTHQTHLPVDPQTPRCVAQRNAPQENETLENQESQCSAQ